MRITGNGPRLFFLLAACLTATACSNESAPTPRAGDSTDAVVEHSTADQYKQYCAECHEGGVPRAPHSVVFQMLGPDAILESMDNGVMRSQAASMTPDERRRLAEFLGGAALDSGDASPVVMCGTDAAGDVGPAAVPDWGMTPGNTRFVDSGVAGLTADQVSNLELKWAFEYPRATRARSQPVVAGNTIYVGSQDGTVYALDLRSGCAHWTFRAAAEVRSAIALGPGAAAGREAGLMAYFGDFEGQVYALDAASGALLWKTGVNDHPDVTITGSPKLHGDRLYVPLSSREWASAADPAYPCCTFRGGIAAFDTATGQMVWKSHTIAEQPRSVGQTNAEGAAMWAPAGAPVWDSPTIDENRRLVYVGTGQGYTSPAAATSDSVIAFDMDDGSIRWVHQATAGDAWNMSCFIGTSNCPAEDGPDFDIGASPILLELTDGRELLLVGQKSGFVFALDPGRKGALVWKKRIGLGGFAGGVHWGMAAAGDVLFAPNADTNFINKWKGERKPGMYALDAATGDLLWFTPAPDICAEADKPACDPGLSAAVTAIPGVVFAGAFDGHLRAYDSSTGAIIWDFDTNRSFTTVSGATAHGGSIESDGPVAAGGYLLVNSGYLFGSRMGGNVLLAFGPKNSSD